MHVTAGCANYITLNTVNCVHSYEQQYKTAFLLKIPFFNCKIKRAYERVRLLVTVVN